MAGEAAADSQFQGLAKYFNSTTMRGRANVIICLIFICWLNLVALATYGTIAAIILYNKLKPSKPAPATH